MKLNIYGFSEEFIGLQGLLLHTDTGLLRLVQDDDIGEMEIIDHTGSLWPFILIQTPFLASSATWERHGATEDYEA
ncbi:hypothetical protein HPP92_018265 [Vanilla planifolia]|uniref:Uncharacterized protein n=1 Tax=Vanilla planifolia TaxID=51239 RepID=A0A835Q6I9_VANPL|nr:hypothetical protein HPP92_018881 [Vanilla planifolia]KAG0468937.1 hypothetical protein HPP92_018265 [Vanilla planifolia]